MNAQRLTALRRLMTELYNCGFAMADGDEEDVRPSELIETDIIMALSELESDNAALTKRVAELEEEIRRRAELYTSNETVLRQMCDDLQWHIRNLQSQLEAKDKRVAELEEQLVHYDSQATAVRVALSTAGIPESEPYPDEPGLSEHERSLRAGGWMLKAPERIGRLAKRVAELENEKAEVSEYAEELAAMVGDLQSVNESARIVAEKLGVES